MSNYQNQSGANHIRNDEYGNPISHTATTGDYGTTGVGKHGTGTGMTGTTGAHGHGGGVATGLHEQKEHHGVTGMLHRSGSSSSSSSSSEDDGLGGRRKKKGMKDKIKEKLPGTGNKDHTNNSSSNTTPTTGGYVSGSTGTEQHEKKGVMDKIKEKLPGGHH